jgi:ribosomal protein S27AE
MSEDVCINCCNEGSVKVIYAHHGNKTLRYISIPCPRCSTEDVLAFYSSRNNKRCGEVIIPPCNEEKMLLAGYERVS